MKQSRFPIDLFNGDADGICALQQLRLHTPRNSELISGVKRDINLLARVPSGRDAQITVLDISLDRNRSDLLRLLDDGAEIDYFDHHHAGAIPDHRNLRANIDTSAKCCTSLLVDRHLGGAHRLWAITGAFGDNLFEAAHTAAPDTLDATDLAQLRELGTLLNYNGYGVTVEDLHFHPVALYRALAPFDDPFRFIAEREEFSILQQGFRDDMAQVSGLRAEVETPEALLLILPDTRWSRRISGVYGNELARRHPERAHVLATEMSDGSYRISVRAPLTRKEGAERLCMAFPGGGGRAAAAGINALPASEFPRFAEAFRNHWR